MQLKKTSFHFFVLILLAGIAQGAAAQSTPGSRAETWEFIMQANYLQSSDITFDGGASVSIDSDVGFGFGMAYNVNRLFALRGDLLWNSSDYSANRVLDTDLPDLEPGNQRFNSKLDSATLALAAEFYFVEAKVSPFVNVSAGWTYIDTNIPSGPAQSACWWDPWYGYICDSYRPSVEDTESSYGGALGLRVDLDDTIFLRASIGANYVDYGGGADSDNYTVSNIGIGFSY